MSDDTTVANKNYTFNPKGDISVQELATFFKFLDIKLSEHAFEKLPTELKRHFYVTFNRS